jgi:predicted transcriptional regulator
MKSTEQYLDAVKDRLDLPSDYALAKALGVTRAAVSSYRVGRSMPDDLVCARIAAVIGVEPMEVIAAINYQRAKSDDARSLWESIWGKAAGAIALNLIVCAVGSLAVAPTPANASEQARSAILYIMSNRRRGPKTTVSGLKRAA